MHDINYLINNHIRHRRVHHGTYYVDTKETIHDSENNIDVTQLFDIFSLCTNDNRKWMKKLLDQIS